MALGHAFTRTTISATISSLHHLFSTSPHPTPTPRVLTPGLAKVPYASRAQATKLTQEAITEYLHNTRSIPFSYADLIAKNATFSLHHIISKIPFRTKTFLASLHRFLRYHPINEFEFFYESIGIEHKKVSSFLPLNKFFFYEDPTIINAACALADFGFPWNKLGVLCTRKPEIFSVQDSELSKRLGEFRGLFGLDSSVIIGICLAFPDVLCGLGGSDELLNELKRVLLDTELVDYVETDMDVTYEVCRKIRLFYNLGCKEGEVTDLLVRSCNIFVDYTEDDLVGKIDFFCRLGVDKEQVGLLLLSKPEIFGFDLDYRVISVLSLLKHFNLSLESLQHVEQNYPYVLGNNRMVNVPHIIRAMDLSEWFFNIIKVGDHSLLATYASSGQGEDTDDDFKNNIQKVVSGRKHVHTTTKLEFLHGIGFGENKFTLKILPQIQGTSSQLYERFNILLSLGIKFSKICKMISLSPKFLNQNTDLLERKVKFLCEEMNSSLEYLVGFPNYLLYNLENRIMPRYNFFMWLKAQGWYSKKFGITNMLVMSEKEFITRISNIHPDAPKWFESQEERRKQVVEKAQST